ncbi:MAG: universal stress protein [Gemmatimonadales bacterium]
MLRSILVPVDGSPFAEKALALASRLARASGATLHLVLAHDPTQGIGPFGEFGPPSVLLIEELERREETYLARTAARLQREGVRVMVHHEDGFAGRVIARTAGAVKAGLVVMSTHGRSGVGRLGLGSVADDVVRHLEIPVLLVPAPAATPRGVPGRRVLVPVDLSAESLAVLPALEELAGLGARRRGPAARGTKGVRVMLIHVVVPVYAVALPSMPYPMSQDAALTELRWEQAKKQLTRAAAAARRRGFAVSTRLVAGARAASTVLEHLHHGRFDLVAMTTHGYGGLRRLLLGSVANKVIRNARKPVLLVRPSRHPRAARK